MERSIERRYERRGFVGRMLGTGQGRRKYCGKAKGKVDPSMLGKTTLLQKLLLLFVYINSPTKT